MRYKVSDIAELVAEHIEGGLCKEHPTVFSRINEAESRLVKVGDDNHLLDEIRIKTTNNNFTLPRGYIAARLASVCSFPVPIYNRGFEFSPNGLRGAAPSEWQFQDDGFCVLQFPMPQGSGDWTLLACSMSGESKSMKISGLRPNGESAEEDLQISKWQGTEGTLGSITHYSGVFRDVSGVSLPEGLTDYVTLFAVDEDMRMCFLAKYHPADLQPQFRRYRLSHRCESGVLLHVLAKREFLPHTRMDDVLYIQDLPALKQQVISIELENRKALEGSVAYATLARNSLNEARADKDRGLRFTMNIQGMFGGIDYR